MRSRLMLGIAVVGWIVFSFWLWGVTGNLIVAALVAVIGVIIWRFVLAVQAHRRLTALRLAEHDKLWVQVQLPHGETDSRDKMRKALGQLLTTTNKIASERGVGRGSMQPGFNVIPEYDKHKQKINVLTYTVTCDREQARDINRAYRSQFPHAFVTVLPENPLHQLEAGYRAEHSQGEGIVAYVRRRRQEASDSLRERGLPEPLAKTLEPR